MYRFVFIFAVVLSVGALSQVRVLTPAMEYQHLPKLPSLEDASRVIESINVSPPVQPQAVTFTTIYPHTSRAQFGYFWPNSTPLVYEPISGILGFIQHEQLQSTTNDFPVRLTLRYSTNLGTTWLSQALLTTTNVFYGMPQLGLANPTNATTQADLALVVSAYRYPSSNGYRRDQTSFLARVGGQMYEYSQPGPGENNDQGYTFGNGKLSSFSSGSDRSGFAYCGVLFPPNDQVQYGQYGSMVINARLSDEIEDFIGAIPSTWDNAQFRTSPSRQSSYNGPMLVDADNEGNIYAVINAIFADDENNRVVAFSKSTDMGRTWSSFTRMPVSVLQSYADSRGAQSAAAVFPYQQDGLSVIGVDHFSYVYRVGLINEQSQLVALDIVEAEYNSGTWTLRPVASLNALPPTLLSVNDSLTEAGNYQQLVCEMTYSPLGNEIEIARSADGSELVVKWIDENPNQEPVAIDPPQTVRFLDPSSGDYLQDSVLTSVPVYNIYVATRNLSSSSWSDPINLTNDRALYKGTHIPKVIPGLDRIPLLVLRPYDDNQWSTTSPFGNLLRNSQNEFVARIYNLPHNVSYARISAVASVNPQTRVSSVTLHVTPNPASDVLEVAFSEPLSSVASLVLVNALGQVVQSRQVEAGDGVHGVYIDVQSLSAGTYYVQLRTRGGILATKPIAVVR